MNTNKVVRIFKEDKKAKWSSIKCCFLLSKNDLKRMESGHPCNQPEDRFAMALIHDEFIIVRWTGVLLFHVKIKDEKIVEILYNSSPEQVRFDSDKEALQRLVEIFRDFLNIDLKAG